MKLLRRLSINKGSFNVNIEYLLASHKQNQARPAWQVDIQSLQVRGVGEFRKGFHTIF